MFPSSRNNSWSFTNNDENPNISTPEEEEQQEEEQQQQLQHTPSSFLQYFTSPFLPNDDDDDDDDVLDNPHLFSQQQQLLEQFEATQQQQEVVAEEEEEEEAEIMISPVDQPSLSSKKRSISASGGGKKKQTQPRKRPTGKKDRHSKIYTAQGPRDRRMRLSLQIARKFFDLQDILGFDKASKTIEWLFTKSRSAIKDLMATLPPQVNNHRTCNYASQGCDEKGASQLIKQTSSKMYGHRRHKEIMGGNGKGVNNNIERKSRTPSSSLSFHPLSKDCRDKARARARERTREKMIRSLDKSKHCYYDAANPNNYLEQATGGSSPFEIGGEESSSSPSLEMNSPPIILATAATEVVVEEPAVVTHLLEHQMATVGIMDKFLGMESSTLTSPSILNYPYHTAAESSDHGIYSSDDFLGYHQGGWGMEENARIQSNYCAIADHIDPNSTGNNIHHQQQNPSTGFMITSNVRLQSQFLGN